MDPNHQKNIWSVGSKKLGEFIDASDEKINDVISKTKLELSLKFTLRIYKHAVYLRRALQDTIDAYYLTKLLVVVLLIQLLVVLNLDLVESNQLSNI